MITNNHLLKDMVDAKTLEQLISPFASEIGIGTGIYLPNGERVGDSKEHQPFCSYLRSFPKGNALCLACDRKKIEAMANTKTPAVQEYTCHAGLTDICAPIMVNTGKRRELVGIFFTGQIVPANKKTISTSNDKKINKIAEACGIPKAGLLNAYVTTKRKPTRFIKHVRNWTKTSAAVIAKLVTRRLHIHRLWLDIINQGDNESGILRAVKEHITHGEISVFLLPKKGSGKDSNRIYLKMTSHKDLDKVIRKTCPDNYSYQSGEGFTGWVFGKGEVLHVANVHSRTEPVFDRFDAPNWSHKVLDVSSWKKTKSYLGVPIKRAGSNKILGVIRAIRLKGQPAFNTFEIESLTGIGVLLADLIEKAELSRINAERSAKIISHNVEAHQLAKTLFNLKDILRTNAHTLQSEAASSNSWMLATADIIERAESWARTCTILGKFLALSSENTQETITALQAGRMNYSAISLNQLVNSIADYLKPQALGLGVNYDFTLSENVIIYGDRHLLWSAIENIFENAMVHGSGKFLPILPNPLPNVRIKASLTQIPAGIVRLEVSDDGIGLTTEQLNRMRRIFGDVREIGYGASFGVTVIAFVALMHNGSVRIEPNKPQGVKLTMTLPCNLKHNTNY